MSLVRSLARPMLAASFVASGVDQTLHPMTRADAARPVAERLCPAMGLPADPEIVVRANGAVMAAAGAMLALGRLPRLSSLVLAVSLVPTAYADHGFWREDDPEARRTGRNLFLRDLGLLGGVLLAAVDTAGNPGPAWRGRRAVAGAERAGRRARRAARRAVRTAKRTARIETSLARRAAAGVRAVL